jgi:hypothetical protein
MYLDFFDGTKKPDEVPHLDALMYFPENYRAGVCRENMNRADAIVMEISSLKIFRHLDHHYQMKMVQKTNKEPIMTMYTQTLEDLAGDLQIIQKRVAKPVIFVGHIDLNFYDVPGVNGHIAERAMIDAVLKKHCANSIILKDVFKDIDYKNICDFSLKKDDTHHITNASKRLLLSAVIEQCRLLELTS